MKAARTPIDAQAVFAKRIADFKRYVRSAEDLQPQFMRVAAAVRALSRLLPIRVELELGSISVNVDVKSMDEVAPVLEEIAEALGIEFDKTNDHAEHWGAWREFRCAAAPWLKVDANVLPGSDECTKVKVGEKLVPVFEIRCGADGSPPDGVNTPF